MAGFSDTDNDLSRGVKPTHIGPETGDTASATTGGRSAAGTRGQPSPAPAAGIDRAGDAGKRRTRAKRALEAGDKTQDA